MEIELTLRGIQFVREHQVDVRYEGEVVGIYYLDFWVEDVLVVELKAMSHFITNRELAQCLRYMQVTSAQIGLIHNFGLSRLEKKRIVAPKPGAHTIQIPTRG